MVTHYQLARHLVRRAPALLAYGLMYLFFLGLLFVYVALTLCGIAVLLVRAISGAFPGSVGMIFVGAAIVALAVLATILLVNFIGNLVAGKMLVGQVVWVEEAVDHNGPQEWLSTVRLSCLPDRPISTPTALPYHGTRLRMMVVWVDRASLRKQGPIRALIADLI